ncbi:MAG: pilus assembly protein [Candidatus Dormibacteraeota bacterium]|nr:pilus assembly protein [Candidatus Dormibacteraeota bacterium]
MPHPLARTHRQHLGARHASIGQSAVEFALVAPLLFLLLFGIVDFGRAMFYQNEVTNAAREGARIAILASNPCNTVYGNPAGNCTSDATPAGPSVCSAIEGSATLISNWSCSERGVLPTSPRPGWAYVEVDQAPSPSATCPGAVGGTAVATPRSAGNLLITVTIRYYFRPITPIVGALFPSSFYLSSSVCARDEY